MTEIPKIIGLISDIHGLLRVEALRALQNCELIIHAGDVGKPEIILELQKLAPVVAVRGNVDNGEWALKLPTAAEAEVDSIQIYALHDLNDLDLNAVAAGFQIVVSGHTHKCSQNMKSGVLYVNPGSAGPKRYSLPITVARLDLSVLPWDVYFVDLETGNRY